MALIYRSIFETPLVGGVAEAESLTTDWLLRKMPSYTAPVGLDPVVAEGLEARRALVTSDEGVEAMRISLFEDRAHISGDQLRTVITAWRTGPEGPVTAWVDLHRWITRVDAKLWAPNAPGVVRMFLAPTGTGAPLSQLACEPTVVTKSGVTALLAAMTGPDRAVPLMVVTGNTREGEPWSDVEARAVGLQKSLVGIAHVAVLAEGAATELSRMLRESVGPGFDVHSGAVRTYLPGVGGERDHPGRHRFVVYRRFGGQPGDVCRAVVAGPVHRRAVEMSPPADWRTTVRPLLQPGAAADDEYLQLLEAENDQFKGRVDDLQTELGVVLSDNTHHLRAIDRLNRTVAYLERQAGAQGAAGVADLEDDLDVVVPSDSLARARERLGYVVLPASLDSGAQDLDRSADDDVWAVKMWAALSALNAYAEQKQVGGLAGSFFQYCERGEGDVIPTAWVAMHESETTENHPKYRALRTLPVAQEVAPTGEIFMGAHIKIQPGGSPCPRIHFVDDTAGVTGMIHVGWFGDHLDNASKT